MHTETCPKKVLASAVISELQSSDIYLTLKARLFDLRANLNGVRVTEAFLDEIVENEAKYVCHPLYADIRGLIANRTVGHMYNARTGEFHSTQIGAFYRFEKEEDGDNKYLVGYARVPKRNKALCKALSDLFTDNALKFSFEVNCSTYEEDADGTMVIDAAAGNYWEGECVVTFPACETAVAQELIAECLGKGDENMADEEIMIAESETAENVETNESVVAEAEIAEVEVAETETAETIYVTQEHVEIDNVRAYNVDTGEEIEERVVVETTSRTPVTIAEDEAHDDENDVDDEDSTDTDSDDQNDDDNEVIAESTENASENNEDEEQCAETAVAEATNWAVLIAEMRDSIEALRKEIAELRTIPDDAAAVIAEEILSENNETETVIAESVTGDADNTPLMNPFMASISAPKKYTLLEKEEKPAHKYSLLDRA